MGCLNKDSRTGRPRVIMPYTVVCQLLILARGVAVAQPTPLDGPKQTPSASPTSWPTANQPASLPATTDSQPWAKGVSARQKERALSLYRQGNQLFVYEKYVEALKKYDQSLTYWNHPAIHYNMVECLVNLGRYLEAHRHLQAASRYGVAPLGQRLYRRVRSHRALLARNLARIRVICREGAATIVLDGKPLLVGPGETTRTVEPGVHSVVATKPGFIPMVRQPTLKPGTLKTVTLSLIPRDKVVYRRRWNTTWMPWAVVGGGLGVAALSLPLYLLARNDLDTHKERFDALCVKSDKKEGGCLISQPSNMSTEELRTWRDVQSLERRAKREYYASIALLSAGAAIAAAGIVLIILNQPRAVEQHRLQAALARVPIRIVPDLGYLSMLLRF